MFLKNLFSPLKLAAAIDLGGTNTTLALVDQQGKLHHRSIFSTKDFAAPVDFVNSMSGAIEKAIRELGDYNPRLQGIGVGAPNSHARLRVLEQPVNLPWSGVVPLAAMFEDRMQCRASLINDAQAAALGELHFGDGRLMDDFLFVTLGTGIGSAMIANGQLIQGQAGFAGELGHVIMEQNGRACNCGRKGCLETYVAANGLVATYKQLRDTDTLEANHALNAEGVFQAARTGDKHAIAAFNSTGEMLGRALANSVAISNPAAIFLFGGLTQAGDFLWRPVRQAFEKNLMSIYRSHVQIRPSGVPSKEAALLGAASLIFND